MTDIIDRVNSIRTGMNISDAETAFCIRFGDAEERMFHKSRIRQIAVNTDKNPLHRIER